MTAFTRREFTHTLAGGMAVSRRGSLQVLPASAPGSLTDVPGLRVGHFTDTRRPTGCTAILFDSGRRRGCGLQRFRARRIAGRHAPAGQPCRPHPWALPHRRRHFRPPGVGWRAALSRRAQSRLRLGHARSQNPDRRLGGDRRSRRGQPAHPARRRGRLQGVCRRRRRRPLPEGNVGPAPARRSARCTAAAASSGMKGGLGTASLKLGDVVIGALAVVNAAGDILDWRSGRIVAGARRPDGSFADSVEAMRAIVTRTPGAALEDPALRSTTLVVVATNVELTKTMLTKLAMMANCGAGRAIRPYHTTGDGDQLFAVSTGRVQRPDLGVTILGALAADVVAEAIVRGVRAATSVEGWPAVPEIADGPIRSRDLTPTRTAAPAASSHRSRRASCRRTAGRSASPCRSTRCCGCSRAGCGRAR